MTDRELMQMALDALHWDSLGKDWINPKTSDAMYALRDRLAQPETEWKSCRHCGFQYRPPKDDGWHPLEQRGWVELTEDEFEEILAKYNEALPLVVCRAIEAKLKEKNT
jgi:hypothetical protein